MTTFREPCGDIQKRKEIEAYHFPKSFRYFYYYGDTSDIQDFKTWFNEVLETTYKTSDLVWLLNGLMYSYKGGLPLNTAKDMYACIMQLVAQFPLLKNTELLPIDFPQEIKNSILKKNKQSNKNVQ